jgi:hypothetical protein
MKRTAVALTLILTLLFSTAAGIQIVNLAAANFLPADLSFPRVLIMSPENKTYTDNVDLIFVASYNNLTLQGFSCVIDDEEPMEIDSYNVLFQYPDGTVEMEGRALLVGLTDSSHKLTVNAKMAQLPSNPNCTQAPNYVNYSNDVYFTVDTIPPNISILSPEDKTYNTSDVRLDFTVNEPVSWIGYSIDGQTSVTVTGNTTLTGLFDGMYSLAVYAKDDAGNTGTSEIVDFSIDTISPRISILSPENKTYAATDIPLNLTVNEKGSQITYSLDGQENVTIAGNTTLTGLSEGAHNLTFYVTDSVGNTGASETIYFGIEPFPTALVAAVAAAVVSAVVVGVSLLVHFRKRKKLSRNASSVKSLKLSGS